MKRPEMVAAARRKAAYWFERSAELREDEERQVLGHTVKLRPFTWHEGTDYDEAWNLLLAAESKVFYDIGCNNGWFALAAGLVNPELQLVLADASASALAQAARHLLVNGIDTRAHFAYGFVSDAVADEVDFYTWGNAPSGSRHGEHLEATGVTATKIRTTTLDRLAEEVGLVPDLVKIDVEGAEQEVLDGAVGVTQAGQIRFLVEMHATGGMTMASNTTGVLAWCEANGMEAWYLAKHRRLTDPADTAHRGRCHLLLQPAGDAYPEGLADLEQGAALEKVPPILARLRA